MPTVIIYTILIVLCVYTGIRSPDFRTTTNIETLLDQSVPLGLVAIGQLVVILTGGLDMSIGLVGRLSALVAAVVMQAHVGAVVPAILLAIGIGIAIGTTNGLIISATGAVPFIVTLGMFGVLEGVCLAVTQTSTSLVPTSVLEIYTTSVHGLPVAVIVMAGVWLLAFAFLRYTPIGRHFYATGGDSYVARTAGIRIHRTRIVAYAISGLLGAIAGLFLLSQSGVANNSIAANLEFQSIVAVALGGASLFGGSGNVAGTLGAVLLLTVVTDVFQVLQINPYYQNVFQGGVILVAIALYAQSGRRAGAPGG
jgi:ribose transport system permease protein